MTDAVGTVTGGVFVSYRRVDSSPWALRIADHLVVALGADKVFVDVDALSPGEDFVDVIETTLRHCPVVLVLIGRQWLTVQSPGGTRRLDDPGDLVRIEVATALERAEVVVPVLLDGASLPAADDLPAPLRGLAHAVPLDLSAQGFDVAMTGLLDRVHGVLGRPRPTWRQRWSTFLGSTAGLLTISAAALGLIWLSATLLLADGGDTPDAPPPAAAVAVPDGASELFIAEGTLWLWSREAGQLRSLSGSELDVVSTLTVEEGIEEVAVVDGGIWVETGTRGELGEVDPEDGRLLRVVDTGADVTALVPDGHGGIWVGVADESSPFDDTYGSVAALDPASGDISSSMAVASPPLRMVPDDAVLWLLRNDDTVARLDLDAAGPGPDATGVTVAGPMTDVDGAARPVEWNPVDLVLTEDSVWAVDGTSDVLFRLDPVSGDVVGQTPLDAEVDVSPGRALSVTDDGVWVHARDRMLRIDPESGEVDGQVALPRVDGTLVDDDDVWGLSRDGDEQVVERWRLADVLEPA